MSTAPIPEVVYYPELGKVWVVTRDPFVEPAAGERKLEEGEVVSFPPGPDGAHGLRNDTEEGVRYVMAGTRVSPEVVEYPDLKQVTAQSRHESTTGGELFLIHDMEEGT